MTRRRQRSSPSRSARGGVVAPHLADLHRFETLAEFVACIPHGHKEDRPEWRLGSEDSSFEACRRSLTEGLASQRTLEAAAAVRDRLEAAVDDLEMGDAVLRKIVRGVEGDDLDVGRYLDGREDCWTGIKRRKVVSRIVRIGVNAAMSCGTAHDAWPSLMGTAAALCDILSRLGFGVEIVGMSVSCRGERSGLADWCGGAWTLKRSDDPMDLEAVASMGRPGLCRWVHLAWAQDRGMPNGGYAHAPTAEVKEWAGIDYLLTHSWVGKDNRQILEAVREVIASAQEPAAA